METEIARITKLKGIENWAAWKFQVRVTLQSNSSWDAITSTPPEREAGANEVTHNQAVATWTKKDSTKNYRHFRGRKTTTTYNQL